MKTAVLGSETRRYDCGRQGEDAMRSFVLSLVMVVLGVSGVVNAQRPKTPSAKASPIRAQQLVDDFVKAHPDLAALEIALTSPQGCRTIAATAREDVGEKCDADELGPIRTGKPDVEEPTKADPVYDITQALHDAAGTLIGAAGMDLQPAVGNRAAAIARAAALLRELESLIPSKAALTEPIPR